MEGLQGPYPEEVKWKAPLPQARSDKLRTQRQGQGSSGGGAGPRRTHRAAAGSQLLTLPRTSRDGATGSKEAPLGAGVGASP